MSRLDPWRNGLDSPKGEDADRILQANFDEQAKFNDKIGIYLLGEAKSTTSQSISSTDWVDVTGLKISAAASGGLIQLSASVYVIGNNNVATLRLMAGTKEICQAGFNYNGINAGGSIHLFGAYTAAEGQTVFKVQAKASAGTVTAQNGSNQSSLYVLEFCKG